MSRETKADRPSGGGGQIETTGLAARLERVLAAQAGRAARHPLTTLALAATVFGVAMVGASRLDLDADLTHLLPGSFDSVKALDAMQDRFGSIGFVVVVGLDSDRASLERFARDAAERIEKVQGIRYVDWRRPSKFFEDHALYFLDAEDLEEIRSRLAAREKWERKRHNPMYVDLEGGEPPGIDFSDIEKKYESRADQRWVREQSASEYYYDPHREMIVLLARPAFRSSDLDYAKDIVAKVEASLADMDPKAYGPDFHIEYTGRYVKKIDQQAQIQADLALASSLALLLVVLYLTLHFRRARSVGLVLTPLVVGLGVTFGLAGFLYGTLNLLTGFVGAILIGLGIDHGVHLLGRYEAERSEGSGHHEAVARAFGRTGRGVVVAGITTAVAFAGVSISEFRAFREFGVIAAIGSMLVILSYTNVLPAMLSVAARRWSARPKAEPGPYARILPKVAPTVLWVGLVVLSLLVMNSGRVRFDYDFSSLEGSDLPSYRLDAEVNRILGYSQTPSIVLTDDVSSEAEVAKALRDEQAELGGRSTVDFVASVSDLVPVDQPRKAEILKKIGKILARVKPKWLDGDTREQFEEMKKLVAAEPFDRASLPVEVRRQFQGADQDSGVGFVLVFPRVSLSDGEAVVRFADEVRSAVDAPVAGEAMILADILHMVVPEAPWVLGITLGLGLLTLWLLLGGLRDAGVAFAAALGSLGATFGLLPMVGIDLNYLDIVIIPVLFGIGVDGAVHMTLALSSGGDAAHGLQETGRAVSGALLTTMFGFGTLLVADHPGLRSLAELALVGLAVNLLVSLLLVPAFELMVNAREARRDLSALVSTVGWAGLAPVAPGTLGALIALPMAWALPGWGVWVLAGVVALVGYFAARVYVRGRERDDPQEVVVDELAGSLLAMAFVPGHPGWLLAAFGLFRFFDIFKPWPVGPVDRAKRGALSIMGDDLVAGLMAGALLLAVRLTLT